MATQPQINAIGIIPNHLNTPKSTVSLVADPPVADPSRHQFIPIVPLFLPMDYFSVFFLSLGDAFSVAISFVPLCLSGHDSLMQNKPNPSTPGTITTSYATKIYTNIPPRQSPKNKPNQTRRRARGGPIPRPLFRHCQADDISFPFRKSRHDKRYKVTGDR